MGFGVDIGNNSDTIDSSMQGKNAFGIVDIPSSLNVSNYANED